MITLYHIPFLLYNSRFYIPTGTQPFYPNVNINLNLQVSISALSCFKLFLLGVFSQQKSCVLILLRTQIAEISSRFFTTPCGLLPFSWRYTSLSYRFRIHCFRFGNLKTQLDAAKADILVLVPEPAFIAFSASTCLSTLAFLTLRMNTKR